MKCPVCNVGMIVVEYEEIELDHCVKCGGVWFDRDELAYMLEGAGLKPEALEIKAATRDAEALKGETKRRCPRCSKVMKKAIVGGTDPVVLDTCARHGGYWFDKGELGRTVRSGIPEGDWRNVGAFLGRLFGPENAC